LILLLRIVPVVTIFGPLKGNHSASDPRQQRDADLRSRHSFSVDFCDQRAVENLAK
jgi:hypothetical protein